MVFGGGDKGIGTEFEVVGLLELLGPATKVIVLFVGVVVRGRAFELSGLEGGFGFLHDCSEVIVVDVLFAVFVLIRRLAIELILGQYKVFVDVLVSITFFGFRVEVLRGHVGVFDHCGEVVLLYLSLSVY